MDQKIDHPEYTTLAGAGEARFEEKRSVFLGHAAPVDSEEQALDWIRTLQKQYADATHNVWAYRLADGVHARYSDDGEPQGSSGLPTLEAIRHAGVSDAVVVITRYFGGTLLGVGGLVRAYTATAQLALEAAGIVTYRPYCELSLDCSYSDYQKLTAEWPRFGVLVDDCRYTDRVSLRLAVPAAQEEALRQRVCALTAARCTLRREGVRYDRPTSP